MIPGHAASKNNRKIFGCSHHRTAQSLCAEMRLKCKVAFSRFRGCIASWLCIVRVIVYPTMLRMPLLSHWKDLSHNQRRRPWIETLQTMLRSAGGRLISIKIAISPPDELCCAQTPSLGKWLIIIVLNSKFVSNRLNFSSYNYNKNPKTLETLKPFFPPTRSFTVVAIHWRKKRNTTIQKTSLFSQRSNFVKQRKEIFNRLINFDTVW